MDAPSFLNKYLRYRAIFSPLLLIAAFALGAVGSILTQRADVASWGLKVETWELIVWEVSSRVVILALVPVILLFDRWTPLTWKNWRRTLPMHLAASVVFSVAHVSLMWGLRKVAYAAMDRQYSYNHWFDQFLYEYLKDVRTFFALLFVIYAYRFILLRLQGEASELDTSESKPPAPTELTERFLVRKLDKEFLIASEEIERLESQGNYVYLHVKGRAYPLRSTMASIATRLDAKKFVRVHRSHIVNTEFLSEIEPLESGDARLKMRDGTLVACSRTYRGMLKERVGG